jgi:NADP-dependent 3-hydroxy acid dehydrogenase YdfG
MIHQHTLLVHARHLQLEQAAEELLDRHVDVLINCAGISSRGSVVETQIEVDRRLMDVNLWGAVALTKAVLPGEYLLTNYGVCLLRLLSSENTNALYALPVVRIWLAVCWQLQLSLRCVVSIAIASALVNSILTTTAILAL